MPRIQGAGRRELLRGRPPLAQVEVGHPQRPPQPRLDQRLPREALGQEWQRRVDGLAERHRVAQAPLLALRPRRREDPPLDELQHRPRLGLAGPRRRMGRPLRRHCATSPLFSLDGQVSMEALRTMQDILIEYGMIKKKLPIEEHVAREFFPVRM